MDSEHRMVGHIQKNMGMSNVRHVRDIYNVRQDTLERRLIAAKNMSPGNRISIYATWLQHRICDKNTTCNSIREADTLCSVAVRLRCTEDMLRHVWKDCVRRAATDLSSAERERIKELGDHLDEEISKWFKRSHRRLSQAPVAQRYPPPSVRRDTQQWCSGAPIREAPQASYHVEEPPIAAPDNWGMVPDEWYECPNCGETGAHYAQYCPNIHHALGPIPRHDPRPPACSGPRQGVYERRGRDETTQPRPKFPTAGTTTDSPRHESRGHATTAGPRLNLGSSMVGSDRLRNATTLDGNVGGQGDQRTIAIRETTRLQRPGTGSRGRGWSPEPGEVEERQTLHSHHGRTVVDQRPDQTRKRSRGIELAEPSGEGSSREMTDVRRPNDPSDDLFAEHLVTSSSRHKRLRQSGPDAEDMLYHWDTERAQPSRDQPVQPTHLPPEPVEERVGRWRSDVLASSQEAAKGSAAEADQYEPGPEQVFDGDDEDSVVINISAQRYDAQHQSLAPAIEPPTAEDERSSPETTPFHMPIRLERRSSPLQTLDVTTRPLQLPVRPRSPVLVRGYDEVIIKPECEDITDMMNAQEAAESFLDRLATSLDAGEVVQIGAGRAHELNPRAIHTCPNDKPQDDHEMDLDSASGPVETNTGDDSPRVDIIDDFGLEEREWAIHDFAEPPIEASHDSEPQYTLPVLRLFRGQAPPQLNHWTRRTAVAMWESANSEV